MDVSLSTSNFLSSLTPWNIEALNDHESIKKNHFGGWK
jgi:hypothetical protein